MISIKDYFTASGRYPERENHKEITAEIIANAGQLLSQVNAFLAEIGIKDAKVSSGWRPSAVNSATPGAAKKSLHLNGQAIDIVDPSGDLDALVGMNDKLLKKYGLFQEHPDSTKGWCHLDCGKRSPRAKNVFIP